jgi:hypothetical protein
MNAEEFYKLLNTHIINQDPDILHSTQNGKCHIDLREFHTLSVTYIKKKTILSKRQSLFQLMSCMWKLCWKVPLTQMWNNFLVGPTKVEKDSTALTELLGIHITVHISTHDTLAHWRTQRGGLGGLNPPPRKLFRSFDKAEPDSQFRGKYILRT